MNEPGQAVAHFAFTNGELRGTHLTLHPTCLVHRSERYLETLPLAGITSVRVSFERHTRRLGWGVVLVVLGLVMLAVSAPLAGWASGVAGEMAASGAQGVTRALLSFFRFLEVFASLMPVVALGSVIGGGALCAFGWLGTTLLLVGLPGSERVYSSRGRDTALLDFAEAMSDRLMMLKR